MPFPKLPKHAAYIHLNNPARRNALSLEVLGDLKQQLIAALTSQRSGKVRLLPHFKPEFKSKLVTAASEKEGNQEWQRYQWLLDSKEWRRERAGLPNVLVLRSEGPVFSSGHDLNEIKNFSATQVNELFKLCSEIVLLMKRSPALIVCPIQGLATAAGFQLAMSTDYPIALANTQFCLPGAKLGFPCTSPSTVVSQVISPAKTYRMLATAEPVTAADISEAVDVVKVPEHAESTDTAAAAFESRVATVIERLAGMSGQEQALGKWAFRTQLGLNAQGNVKGSESTLWAGGVMALHAKTADGEEGIQAFLEKRNPVWPSQEE